MASRSLDSFTENYLQGRIAEANMELRAPAAVLGPFGFEVELASSECVSGRFTVTERCCQPLMMLHGGISALISEVLASMGAHIASGFRPIASIELNINHLKAAPREQLCMHVPCPFLWAEGFRLLYIARTAVVAISRLTCLVGPPISPSASTTPEAIKKVSRM